MHFDAAGKVVEYLEVPVRGGDLRFVVFDNRNGTATDMDVANPQLIAGGSIVIHKA